MNPDPWLQRWATSIVAAARGGPVLEIGCGTGDDTAVLASLGLEVVAFDLSPEAVAAASRAAPAARISVQDLLDPFPLERAGIGVVIASLSLHYFGWLQTLALVERIRATLCEGGLLLVRVNSDHDVNFGATGFPELEPGLYAVDDQSKRFFSETDLVVLFGRGWRTLSRERKVSLKYGQPKALWEVAVERVD